MPTLAAKKRVNPLCEEKPRSKPMSAIWVSVATIGRRKTVWLPRIDGDDGVPGELPALVGDVDRCRHSSDMKDQMPLAMRMRVERAIQLIDGRATEPPVKDGKGPAHA